MMLDLNQAPGPMAGPGPLTDYLLPLPADLNDMALAADPDYHYSGLCPRTGVLQRLPRTALARAAARWLMQQLQPHPLYQQEGKMYGVLLVQTAPGQLMLLRGFSGLLQGQAHWPGWVPPISGRQRVALAEGYTLDRLSALKARLITLQQLPQRQAYARLLEHWQQRRQQLNAQHRQRQQRRQQQRQQRQTSLAGQALEQALQELDQASRADKAELRQFKALRSQQLAPLEAVIQAADAEIRQLKRQRKDLSRQLQTAMHAVYTLTNFAGESAPIQTLAAAALPTGTGDCCAPKLLHFAAVHGLTPLGLAEFWWGPPNPAEDKQPGQFYGACRDRCQPIMGFLLSGLSAPPEAMSLADQPALTILFEDDWLVAVDKPTGLLSVPGRYGDRQDSVLSRLRRQLPDGPELRPVHRLDQDTSGVLLLARSAEGYRRLSQQFARRQVEKQYEALVQGVPRRDTGLIDLPLWGDPQNRPRQTVDWQRGKPSQSRFQVLEPTAAGARVRLQPLTGRSHQLRLHAAHPLGLHCPIRGDRLYGDGAPGQRLHLHACALTLAHPAAGQPLSLISPPPF